MKRSGYADLPLHTGTVPPWLAERMKRLGGAIIQCIAEDYGRNGVLQRLSDPLWFQSFGCVLGMDWHSSGITTSVIGALKRSLNPLSAELGIYVCGGRGKHSIKTPDELRSVAVTCNLDPDNLVRASRLTARVDNNAIQDGYQIYLHSFIVSCDGEWTVIQQGMNTESGYARRYHWHSPRIVSFVNEPHSFIYGENRGSIINLVDHQAGRARDSIIELTKENPDRIISEARKITMPRHHNITENDINLKRLGAVLALAYDRGPNDFESILLLEGLGPRTLQSLALVSEIIHGAPCRFTDPARYSFAHGGKDGHPFPVPLKIYDETIEVLEKALRRSKIDMTDKRIAFRNLESVVRNIECKREPEAHLEPLIRKEWLESPANRGRTVSSKLNRKIHSHNYDRDRQLKLFDD